MKKLMLLGGSAQQVIAIETAKKLGLYTIICDYLPDNPGQFVADKFYQISTTDKQAILKIALYENIDAIVAYASDPAAPTAAYVAEKMGLPGNPYEAVKTLCNKDKFRDFLARNGFNTPTACGYNNASEALKDIKNGKFHFPIIIKPVDSSGSKGVSVLENASNHQNAIEYAFYFSRQKRIIVEEFIERAHPYLIGGDIYVSDGKIILWGLLNCLRDFKVNPLVPVGKSYPLELSLKQKQIVRKTLQELITALGIRNSVMNIELIVDKNNQVWPIDIGPRNGGNMIPDLLGYIFNVDVIEMTLRGAIGDTEVPLISEGKPFYATYNIHSIRKGIYENIKFDDFLNPYIIQKKLYKKRGDLVEFFDNAAKVLGIVFFKFPSKEIMDYILKNIDKWIHVNLKPE